MERMREIILDVLEEWSELQPNMASEAARLLLAKDLCDALDGYVNNLIEDIVVGTKGEPSGYPIGNDASFGTSME